MTRLPHVVVPISHGGSVVGLVDINWTGSFSGEIKIEELHKALVERLKTGNVRSIDINFEVEGAIPTSYVDPISQLRETLMESGYCDNEVEAYDLIKQLLDAGVRFVSAEDMKKGR